MFNTKDIKIGFINVPLERTLNAIQVDISAKCNLKCRDCISRYVRDNSEVPLEVFKDYFNVMLGELKIKPYWIFLSQSGEPTTHSQFVECLKHLEENFTGHNICMNSNVINISDELLEFYRTAKNNLYSIDVSIWAWNKTAYKKYHGNGELFERYSNNIKALYEVSKYNYNFKLNFLHPAINSNETKKCIDFLYKKLKLNIQVVESAVVNPTMYHKDRHCFFIIKPYFNWKKKQMQIYDLIRPYVPYGSCRFVSTVSVLTAQGKIDMCFKGDNKLVIWDCVKDKLTKEKIIDMFRSDKVKEIRRLAFLDGIDNECYNCVSKVCI